MPSRTGPTNPIHSPAYDVGFRPAIPDNWIKVPENTGEALDRLSDPYIKRFFDGSTTGQPAVTVVEDGGAVKLRLEASGGGNLYYLFAGIRYELDCTPICEITLTQGTDVAPAFNFVYITESGGVLTLSKSTTSWPTTSHAPVAEVLVPTAALVATDGAYTVHAQTDHLYMPTENGMSIHVYRKLRTLPATWVSGVAPQDLVSVSNDGYLSVNSGRVFQLHEHTFPARDMQAGDRLFVVNEPGTEFNKITSLADVTQDANSNSMTNKYGVFVLWGDQSEAQADCKLFLNLPNSVYATEAKALTDDDGSAVFTIPAAFTGTGFLIAKYVLKRAAGGAWTQSIKVNLRGIFPSTSPSAGGAGALFEVVDDTTPQAGGVWDTNGFSDLWSKGADVISGAALPVLTDGNSFDVTGTTTITSIDTMGIGTHITLHFDAALILTHHATNLILPGGANITTAVGDIAIFYEYATGDWRCISYQIAADAPGGGSGDVVGPASSVDNTFVRFDSTTGKLVQAGIMSEDDTGHVTIGKGAAGVDYILNFNGESNSGAFRWDEDNDQFKFSDDILMESDEQIYFNSTLMSIGRNPSSSLDILISNTVVGGRVVIDSADFVVETDVLFVDATNGRVGFGTISPSGSVHITEDDGDSTRNLTIEHHRSVANASAVINFRRGRGTAAFPSALQPSDRVGFFWGIGYDGTSYQFSAGFGFDVDGTVSSGVVPMGIKFLTGSASFSTERMRLTSAGRLGVGIVVPTAKLHIDQSSSSAAIPVLKLDQADISEEMIEFVTSIGTGRAIEAVGAKSLTTTHFIKITIPGSLTRYIPCGTIS